MNELSAGNNFIQNIVYKYSDMMMRIAYQNLKSQSDAEDVLQEVFLKLIKSEHAFISDEHTKAWLIRVTINQCKDYKKSAWIRKIVPITEEIPLFEKEQKKVMEEIFRLKPDYRNVIYLYYYEEYTIAEIANILDKSCNTISSQLQRARKKLKTIILEEGGFS